MRNLKKSKTTKVVSVFVAVMMLGTVIAPSTAHAITLAELVELLIALEIISTDKAGQARSILAQQQISACPFTWTRDLTTGNTGNDVKKLQQFLNTDPVTQLVTNGPGSPGEETTFFGSLTNGAVERFQEQNKDDILAPIGLLSGTGFFGPLTRAKANELCKGTDVPLDLAVIECLPEQRDVDVCIAIHQPVCATVNVQCITTPCDPVQETFSNFCFACMNSLVDTYTEGECPIDQ